MKGVEERKEEEGRWEEEEKEDEREDKRGWSTATNIREM